MKKFTILIFTLLLSGFAPIAVQSTQAQEIAKQPCDPQFFEQMKARAWLESEREIMQNQNLIFKADSVLEYTCFDRFANVAAWDGGDIFTHTEYFGDMIIPRETSDSLEMVLTKIINLSLEEYQNGEGVVGNFEHNWLGGRGDKLDMEKRPYDVIADRLPYQCNVMAEVWTKAKCLNFVHNAEFDKTDGFHPLETLTPLVGKPTLGYNERDPNDVRAYPANMVCNTEAGIYDWQGAIDEAENRTNLYKYKEPLAVIFEDVTFRTIPGGDADLGCAPPIKTGVEIILSTGPTKTEDGVCTNPGCTYNGKKCTDGSSNDEDKDDGEGDNEGGED